MGFLDRLQPWQRQALMFGAPAVAALALLRRKSAAAPAGVGTLPMVTPSTDAIGVGQLAEFESGVSRSIFELAKQIENLQATPAETPPATPTTPTPHPPATKAPTTTRAPLARTGQIVFAEEHETIRNAMLSGSISPRAQRLAQTGRLFLEVESGLKEAPSWLSAYSPQEREAAIDAYKRVTAG